jgi:hypothetical protein
LQLSLLAFLLSFRSEAEESAFTLPQLHTNANNSLQLRL